MAKTVFVFLTEGFEEVEAVSPVDLLRRAGADVKMVSLEAALEVKGAHGITIVCDTYIKDVADAPFDALVLPGGMPGAERLSKSHELEYLLKRARSDGKIIAAICAAPVVVLAPKGILDRKKFTCFPGMEKIATKAANGAQWRHEKVITDGNLITSRGVGTAAIFAIAIIEKLFDAHTAAQVKMATLVLEEKYGN